MARGKGSQRCKKKSKKIPKQYEKLFSNDVPSTPSTPTPVVSSSSASSSPLGGANMGRKGQAENPPSGTVTFVSATDFLRSLQLQGHHVSKKKFVIAEKFDKMSEDTKKAYCVKIREMMMEAYGWTDDDIESLLKEQGLNTWFGTFFSQLKQPSYIQEFDSSSKTRVSESQSQTSEEGEELDKKEESSKTTTEPDQRQGTSSKSTTVPERDEDDHCLTSGCLTPAYKARIPCFACRKSRCANCLVKFKKGDKVISKIPSTQQVICKDRLHVPLEVALICVFDPASPYNEWILEKEKEAYLLREEYENLSLDDEDSDEDGVTVKRDDGECENVPEELSNLSDTERKEEFECSDKANEAEGESECDDPAEVGGAESESKQEEPVVSPISWKSEEERLRAIHEGVNEFEKKSDTERAKENEFLGIDEGFKINRKMAEEGKRKGLPSEEEIKCMEEFSREVKPESTNSTYFISKDEHDPGHTVDPNEKSPKSPVSERKVETGEMSDEDEDDDDSCSQNLDDSDSPGRVIAEMILALGPAIPDFKFCLGCGELLTILFMSWERYENHKVPLHLYFHEVMLGFKQAKNAQNLVYHPHKSSKLYLASKYSKWCHPKNCQEQRTSNGCKIHFFEEDRDYIKLAVGNLHSWLQEGYSRVLNECIKPLFYSLFD